MSEIYSGYLNFYKPIPDNTVEDYKNPQYVYCYNTFVSRVHELAGKLAVEDEVGNELFMEPDVFSEFFEGNPDILIGYFAWHYGQFDYMDCFMEDYGYKADAPDNENLGRFSDPIFDAAYTKIKNFREELIGGSDVQI